MNKKNQKINELIEKEEYLRLLTENSMDMISKHDLTGLFLFVSPPCIEITGYKPEELIGRNVYDYFHPDDLSNIKKSHDTILTEPVTYTVSYRFKHKSGYYVWLEAKSKTIRDNKSGKTIEIIATTRDITERKKAEDALKQRYEFEKIIGTLAMEFLSLNSNEINIGINKALATIGPLAEADRAYIFQYHEDGITADNTHEWCAPDIDPQIDNLKNINIEKTLPWFSENIHKRKIFSIIELDELPPEAILDKKHFKDQDIVSLIVVPLFLKDKLLGFIGFDSVLQKKEWTNDHYNLLLMFGNFFSHAIERKRIEEELHKSEKRWKFALEGAGDGIWDWDIVSNKVFFSEQWKAMLGFENHEISNSLDEWKKRVHPDDLETALADINRHFSGETEIYQNEHRVLCKDGTYKWILDRGKIIERTKDGKPKRAIGTHADISVIKEAEEEKEKLISELKEALTKIKTLSGLLPICSICKKVRNDQGYWQQIEAYISEHSNAEFSHGICQECMEKHYPNYSSEKESE